MSRKREEVRKPQNHKENVKFSKTDKNSNLTNTGNILTAGDYNCLLLVIIDWFCTDMSHYIDGLLVPTA